MSLEAFFKHELPVEQRIYLICAFVAVGLVLAAQVSQLPEKPPARWARLTDKSRPYWYTLYVMEAFLLVQTMYGTLKERIAVYGYDDSFLNALWLSLLGLETVMVMGLAVRGVVQMFQAQPKLKTT